MNSLACRPWFAVFLLQLGFNLFRILNGMMQYVSVMNYGWTEYSPAWHDIVTVNSLDLRS